MELEQKASQDIAGNEVLEKLGDMVKARDGIERKLSTTYSLGRDSIISGSKSVLPLYDGKQRSYSFQSSKKASVTIFNTTSDLSSSESTSGSHGDSTSEEEMANVIEEETGTSFGGEEQEPLSRTKLYSNPFFVERHSGTSSEDERVVEPNMKARMWLKRRTLSSTN
ncbi:Protein GAMETE EXPRESSED 3 [Acorus gramineus]|uniref:Protein GAMETE EXPRESSED 3 n=1 Tax=Acorus gramineus TaxID=55184 RepID=A0AAV9BWY8_ACOGR|nr:Protein GAMETE EXPRESSED 3 [Acorus gramineus]